MFYYNNKKLLSEGMSLDQIKQGLNADLLEMLKKFTKKVYLNSEHNPQINIFVDNISEAIYEKELQKIYTQEEGDAQFELYRNAYVDFLLVNVIENGQPLESTINIDNPTNGLRGKFTEFILRIVTSNLFENKISNWYLITDFLKICKNSNSNLYKSKNAFFDNVIIPLMVNRVQNGEKLGSVNPATGEKGSNFSRPSPVSPLQDKVMKVFEAYGIYNDKNLLQTILDEVVNENSNQNIRTFAGYDIKLIDYCLRKKYWKEFYVSGQPNTTRLFFIGDGDLESLAPSQNTFDLNLDAAYASWNQLDEEERYNWGDMDNYFEYLAVEGDPSFDKGDAKDSFNFYFIVMALTFACNIYPFKTPYNISKKNISNFSNNIPYIKSLSNDFFVSLENNPEFKIRKTTAWCTKDEEFVAKYISPTSNNKVQGFILCLNDALSYDDPDGSLQIGIEINSTLSNKNITIYKSMTLNANDKYVSCPAFLTDFFNNNSSAIEHLLDQDKENYRNIRHLKFPELKVLDTHEKKAYFEKMTASINEKLLRTYLKYLLS